MHEIAIITHHAASLRINSDRYGDYNMSCGKNPAGHFLCLNVQEAEQWGC